MLGCTRSVGTFECECEGLIYETAFVLESVVHTGLVSFSESYLPKLSSRRSLVLRQLRVGLLNLVLMVLQMTRTFQQASTTRRMKKMIVKQWQTPPLLWHIEVIEELDLLRLLFLKESLNIHQV